ncbi:MAG: hypothetical protein RIS88_47 [Pseudomonadota bacterium]|jgi:hypothetical protein
MDLSPLSPARARVDHLVVMAASIEEGVAWSEAVLGVTPAPGGQHAFMGTHNRLLHIASAGYERAYLEIIAIDPQAPAPARRRWFDMDSPDLRQRIATHGPQLTHFVTRVSDVTSAAGAWRTLGLDAGKVLPASRMTPQGELRWQITIREDGVRLFDGALPTLIEWGPNHPTARMPPSDIRLESLEVRHPAHQELAAAYAAIDLRDVLTHPGEPGLAATLRTPKGLVTLR